MDETVSGAVTRTYAYGVQRISEDQPISSTWTPSFYGYDGHGNVRFLTNSAGTITDSYTYDVFGMPITTSGTTPNNYLYSGEQYDGTLGAYYLRARYYNPATGRFLSMDPYVGHLIQPATLDKYVYAQNDPVDGVDPTGRDAIIEVAFMYARPGFGVLAQGRIQFDPEALLEKGWDYAGAATDVYGLGGNAHFASHIGLCDSLALINVAGVLGGVSNGGQGLSNLTLTCFYNALTEPVGTPLGNPLPEIH